MSVFRPAKGKSHNEIDPLTLEPAADRKEKRIDYSPSDQDAEVDTYAGMETEENLSAAFNDCAGSHVSEVRY